ncbi:F-box only protein 32-like [Patiria miniata]|uniref:F-box domain-containing protein n=1 Tax=Patiria miniata TaxID=46514 RepID=A0A914A223_PATMI|nr:F-box only protein 32-like [Patiria miniata]
MPYYGGYDGESPGNEWVKTASGWKKLIALRENLHRHIKRIARERFQNSCKEWPSGEGTSSGTGSHHQEPARDDVTILALSQDCDAVVKQAEEEISQELRQKYEEFDKPQASFAMISRSVGGRGNYFTLGEIISKLDFASGVEDRRRFNYVCRILELIVTTRFTSLSGLAQKNLFYVIEETLHVVMKNQHNTGQLRRILCGAIVAMNKSRSSHIGCPATWNNRMGLLQCWLEKLNSIKITEREEDGEMMLLDLPDEVLGRILHHLNDARDIINVDKSCYHLHLLATHNLLWRNLCLSHFTEYQITKLCPVDDYETDWKGVYRKLYKRHPAKEVYADVLQICGFCNCLFWMNGGHPCTKELLPPDDTSLQDRPELTVNINLSPQQFLDLFPSPHLIK